jgi:hypothetical protein
MKRRRLGDIERSRKLYNSLYDCYPTDFKPKTGARAMKERGENIQSPNNR